jgi:hypothetical protein
MGVHRWTSAEKLIVLAGVSLRRLALEGRICSHKGSEKG